jgi:hypothetical protein
MDRLNGLPVRPGQKAAPANWTPPAPPAATSEISAPAAGGLEPTPAAASAAVEGIGDVSSAALGGLSDEAKALRQAVALEASAAESAASTGAAAVGIGIAAVRAGLDAYEGKYFRAATDIADISGVPFSFLPDAINYSLDAAGAYFTFRSLGQGGGMGMRSFWSSFTFSGDAYRF